MKAFFSVYDRILNGFKIGSEVVVFLIFLLIVIDVFVRMVGLQPSTYTSAIVEYGLLWFTMLAAPWLVRIKGHVFIDVVTQLLPPTAHRVLAKIVYLICVCSALVFCYFSLMLLVEAIQSGEIDVRGEDMPQWLLLLPLPVCFFMVALEFARYLIGLDNMYGDRTEVRENV